MTPPYFPMPSPLFVAALALALSAFMLTAAWVDWKTWRIPKRLTLSMLAVGVVFHLVGGAWMGSIPAPGWAFADGPALGAVDGLLFALAGAATGFAIFFAFWVLGVGGGGDVKLATALGAWVGPKLFIGVLVFTMPVVLVFVLVVMARRMAGGRMPQPGMLPPRTTIQSKLRGRRPMTFSLPLAVATVLMFLVMFRVPLGLSSQ